MAVWKQLEMFRMFSACRGVMVVQSGRPHSLLTQPGLPERCETARPYLAGSRLKGRKMQTVVSVAPEVGAELGFKSIYHVSL